MRIGFGSDIHRLEEGHPLMLGGIMIPSERGEAAHSDGDVLLHAIIDAILGALGTPDIGELFPPEAVRKGESSSVLLRSVMERLSPRIINVDTIITLEEPKLSGYKQEIRRSVASLLGIDEDRVSIKAKTAEGLGDIGQGLAVRAEAAILLE